MTVCNLSDLPSLLKPGQCLLGLDYGSVIIGVAVADPSRRVASPLLALKKGKWKPLAQQLAAVIQDRNIGGLIIGLPKNMDGTEGASAQAVRSFASNILKETDLPIAFWDERLSTAAVTRFMVQDDMTRQRRLQKVDQAAAAYILQGALDALQQGERAGA